MAARKKKRGPTVTLKNFVAHKRVSRDAEQLGIGGEEIQSTIR